jgi:hypothetical protein
VLTQADIHSVAPFTTDVLHYNHTARMSQSCQSDMQRIVTLYQARMAELIIHHASVRVRVKIMGVIMIRTD